MTTSNFQDLLNAAASNFNTFASNEQSRLTSSTQELYTALADIVAVRELYSLYPIEYGTFISKRGVFVSGKQISKSHPLIRALVPEHLRQDFRSKISLYGQVVDVLVHLNIESDDVVDWLSTAEDVNNDGKPISGLFKAKALHNQNFGKPARPNTKQIKLVAANDNATPDVTIIDEPVELDIKLAFGGELFVRRFDETGKATFIKVKSTAEEILAAIKSANESTAIAA